MSAAPRLVLSRLAVLLVAVAACALAWRVGGGGARGAEADAAGRARAVGEERVASPALGAPESYGIVQRLVEAAAGARVDAPSREAAARIVAAHGRSKHPAWLPRTGPAAPLVTTIALAAGGPKASFEQLDALVAAPPTTFSFRVAVPRDVRLTFAEGTVNAIRDGVAFVVSVVDARGRASEIYRHVLAPTHAQRWTEASCDLAAYAGQTIELRLSTESVRAVKEVPARVRDGGAAKRGLHGRPADPVALWGSPTLLARTIPRISHNVLWISVSGLRADAIASLRDAGAVVPKVAGLTPAIDELAGRGVRFTRAYSAGSWTRPGTLGMLAGARLDELGLDAPREVLPAADVARFYASDPPLLSLVARRHGVSTHAIVDGALVSGASAVGVDLGFEHVVRYGDATRAALDITRDTAAWIQRNKETRFFAFVSYRARAEAAGADATVGTLMQTLAEAGLRDRTIVVVTADHAQPLSSAHARGDLDLAETTHVPVVIAAPGLLPEGRAVDARVRTTDVAPTITELLGLEAHPKMSGVSLAPLARGEKESDERVVVTAARGTLAILHDRYRLVVRSAPARAAAPKARAVAAREALYDLVDDPGERHDLAPSKPEIVVEMRARLDAALKNTPVAGSAAATAPPAGWDELPSIHMRFVGGGRARRVSGTIVIGDARTKACRFSINPVELGREALTITGKKAEIALTTSTSAAVGFDIFVDPPATPVTWDVYVDDLPWPADEVFAGPYGLVAPELRAGIATDAARLASGASLLPPIDPHREGGMFIVRRRARGRSVASLGE